MAYGHSTHADSKNVKFIELDLKLLIKKISKYTNLYSVKVTECPESDKSIQCLEFHTHTKNEPKYYVPVTIIKVSPGADIPSLVEEKVEEYAWGRFHEWRTINRGSGHYFYLQPKDKDFSVRFGIIGGVEINLYRFDWKRITWEFTSQ